MQQIGNRHVFLDLGGDLRRRLGHGQRAHAAYRRVGLPDRTRAEREHEEVGAAFLEGVDVGNDVGDAHALHIVERDVARRQRRIGHRGQDLLVGEADRPARALEVGQRLILAVILHEDGVAQRVEDGDRAKVLLRAAMEILGAGHRQVGLVDIGDAERHFAGIDDRQELAGAAERLHGEFEAGLFVQHLADGGRGRVVDRAGRRRGDGNRLLRRRGR